MFATKHRLTGRLIGASLAIALLASGCGGGDPAEPAPPPTPRSSSSTTPTPTPTPTTAPPTTTPPKPTSSTTTTAPTTCTLGSLAGKDVERLATTRRVVALTFDGGASSAGAQSILDTLSSEGVPATFFLTGRFAQSYPGLSRTIGSRYPVGNHTQTHPDLTTLSRSAVVDEIRAGRASITTYAGVESRSLFRFPFGARNATTIGLVNDECYVAYRWTVDTLGWKGTSGAMTTAKVHDRVLSTLQPGQIVLMHLGAHPQDGSTLDADALPEIIESIRAAGYGFVTLRG